MKLSSYIWVGSLALSACATLHPATNDLYPARENLERLISEEDTDNDSKITVHDPRTPGSPRGDRSFDLVDVHGTKLNIKGTYALSTALQELKLAIDRGQESALLTRAQLNENPVDRTHRLIKSLFWDSLTRRIDREGLRSILHDEKMASAKNYLYVPTADTQAFDYFSQVQEDEPQLHLEVRHLPERITMEYVAKLTDEHRHGLLTLKLEPGQDGQLHGAPFVVPGGRFNEMYGWDSYFIALGLIQDGRVELARAMVDNFDYQIRHYGKILNANRTYYLTRSQPPFLTSMIRAVWNKLPPAPENRAWLRHVLEAAILEYRYVWTAPPKIVPAYGLSRYYDLGRGPSPEVERGHYNAVVRPEAQKLGLAPENFVDDYLKGKHRMPGLDAFFRHDRALRESGHDTTYRFDNRTTDFFTVDLNTLLYKYETDIADILDESFEGSLRLNASDKLETSRAWRAAAARRKAAINKWLWDNKQGFFFDYDTAHKRRSGYVSTTGLYPLWAGLASPEQARRAVAIMRAQLEMPAGLAATAEASRGKLSDARPPRQWDFPFGWAPLQMLTWEGLRRYGFNEDADRLTYKWLFALTRNTRDYNGTMPEKIDVVTGSHDVFVEYGNVGTKFAYITKEGFGWMNASYEVGFASLPSTKLEELKRAVAH